MIFIVRRGFFLLLGWLCFTATAAEIPDQKPKTPAPPFVAPASDEAEMAIKKFKPAPGFKIDLFAAEPMFANPVCFSIDEKGRIYVAETFRLGDGVLDIRGHMNWLNEELASKTTAEHLAKLKKYRAETPDMTAKTDRISLLEDTNGDGKADKATVFADGFTNILDGLGAGVLARKGDVYYTCIPDLYLLRDENRDGKADFRKSLQTGYGVRTAFSGHDLHGLRFGPDGKLYFSCGDRGFSIKQSDHVISSLESGAVLRCDPDGSNLEIFATGLRNPQELVFDKFGDLWTGDNNADGGDLARWVYLVEGGDSGWRIGYQFINQPTVRGPWNSEKIWDPEKALEIGFVVPPVADIASGPAGLTYYPGVGFPEKYDNHFFLVDFRGSASQTLVHSFTVKAKGASFELVDREDFLSNILATDVDFGPDGAIYISDWVAGWGPTGKGRIYRMTATNAANVTLVAETKKIIGEGMEHRSAKKLAQLLSHPDQRVRQEAQFALAAKGENKILLRVAQKNTSQLARLHAIWGLGQIVRSKISSVKQNAIFVSLAKLLNDSDPEVRAQAAKVLGEGKFAPAYDRLAALVVDTKNARVQFFAAMALGKLGDPRGVKPVLEMLRTSNNQDAYLRHAGVMALLWINDVPSVYAAAKDESAAVRLASLIVLRHWQKPEIAQFLNDKNSNIVEEAARAINDLPVVEALPELAAKIGKRNSDETFMRRVLNANYRVGTRESAEALAAFSTQKESAETLRGEALEMLGEWKTPPGLDKVTGLWRPLPSRDGQIAANAIKPYLSELLKSSPAKVQIAAVKLAGELNLPEISPELFALVKNKTMAADARLESLKILAKNNDTKLLEAVQIAATDKDENLRKEALTLQAKLKPAQADNALTKALESGSVGEKQTALTALGSLKTEEADVILNQWLDKLLQGTVPAELQLELLQAAAKRDNADIKIKLQKYNDARPKNDDLASFRECLAGGNAAEGRKIFFERVEASCVRCHKVGTEGGEA
ncbi:MAG: PVC-type heme-binding CxxCH protein, partial [Verrucomicrobiota bacterium]